MSSFADASALMGRVVDEIGYVAFAKLAKLPPSTVRNWRDRDFTHPAVDTFIALLGAASDHETGRRRGKRGEPGRPPKSRLEINDGA